MTNREISLCSGIIHSAGVVAAVGGDLAQVPASDNLVIPHPVNHGGVVGKGIWINVTSERS